MLHLLLVVLLLYTGLMLSMFLLQRRLMYHPVQTLNLNALEHAPDAKLIALTTHDKTAIAAWHIPAKDDTLPLIVYFHGNAGHIGDRIAKLNEYVAKGFGLLAVSYRGFGNSTGKPSEPGLYDDAMTTVRNATQVLDYPPSRILLVGESLGSGVAVQTAKSLADAGTPAFGLMLEAPYTSVANRSQELYPFVPAFYLVRDRYESIKKIRGIRCPLLVVHGEADAVIPVHHGRTLLDTAEEPKRGVFYPDIGHTDFDAKSLADELERFARENQR